MNIIHDELLRSYGYFQNRVNNTITKASLIHWNMYEYVGI
jgi:hypothetical protein